MNAIFYLHQKLTLTVNNLAEFPFVRYNKVRLNYESGSRLIVNTCAIFESQLQNLPRLNEANSFCNWAILNRNTRTLHSHDQTQFIEHLCNRLLPICGSYHRFEFHIGFAGVEVKRPSIAVNIIESVLQI